MARNTDPRKFALDVQAFSEAVELSMDQIIRKLAFDALAGMLRRSPVRTGRFRASWRVGIKSPDLSVEPVDFSGGSASPNSSQTGKINQATIFDEIHISNNLPYAEVLELGSSTQAPSGILRVTFEQMVAEVSAVAQQIGRRNGIR